MLNVDNLTIRDCLELLQPLIEYAEAYEAFREAGFDNAFCGAQAVDNARGVLLSRYKDIKRRHDERK